MTPPEQLAASLEQAIRSGTLAAGSRLPPTIAMARQHGVTVHAMQGALSRLQERGLLLRKRRSGTVVAPHAGAAVLGVVMGGDVLSEPHLRVYGLVLQRLAGELAGAGFRLRLYPPDRDAAGAFAEDLGAGRLRAVLALDRHPDGVLPAGAAPLPVLGMPWPDYRLIGHLGARHLLAGGAAAIAAVPPIPHGVRDPADDEFRAGVAQALAEAGAGADRVRWLPGGNQESYGRAALEAALATGAPPEAWLVADDNAARGILTGLLVRGLPVPTGSSFACHANRGLDLLPPLAPTRLEIDPAAAARAVTANLLARLAGRPEPVPRLVPALIPGSP